MDLEDIVRKLEARYKNKSKEMVRAVALDIVWSGVETLADDEKVVKKLFDRWESKKSEADAKDGKTTADSPDHCPICKLPMKPVKLDNDRPAKWCPKHMVVYPTRPSVK